MDRAPTVSELIDRRPMSRYQIWTMALCGGVIVLDGFDTQSIGFLAPSMAETLHVPVKTFGPIFAAALVGLMISSMLSGPIADRWGRKWPIVACTLIAGLFAMFTSRCTSVHDQLLAFRFLTGLGLGGALSNSVALMSEYAPKRLLAVIVSMMFCGMPAGAVLATRVSAGDAAALGLAIGFLRRRSFADHAGVAPDCHPSGIRALSGSLRREAANHFKNSRAHFARHKLADSDCVPLNSPS